MGYAPIFVVGQSDTLPSYTVSLTDTSNTPVNLSTAISVVFTMSNAFTGLAVFDAATVVNALAGTVQYTWSSVDTLTPGIYAVEWEVTWSDSTTTTYPLTGYDFVTVMTDLAMGYPNVTPAFNTIWSSGASPTSANGNNGDFWYDTATGYFYGPKNGGAWPAGFLLSPSLIPLNDIAAPTGNVSLANYKVTNLQYGTGVQDAAAFGQIPQMGIDITQAPYAADPTGANDCTTAFNLAISTLNSAGGGTILCPSGKYVFAGSAPVTLNTVSNIKIQGTGGFSPTGSATAGTIFYYEGTSTGDFIQVINSFGIVISDVSFSGSSSSWTGNYINTTTVTDTTSNFKVQNCYFYNGTTVGATDLNLCNSQAVDVENCYFVYGTGNNDIVGSTSSLTSQAININNCVFIYPGNAAIYNPSIDWNITGCNFTGNGITHAAGVLSTSLSVTGNYINGSSVCVNTAGSATSVTENFLSGTTGIYIDAASTGLVIKGNEISNCTTGIQTVDTIGVDISNNFFAGCTTATSYNATSTNLVTNGDFHNGVTSWSAVGSAVPTVLYTDSVGGDSECLQLVTAGGTLGGTQQATIACTGSTVYQVSCWIKLNTASAGTPVLTITDSTSATASSSSVTTTGTWQRRTISYTTASAATSFTVKIATTGSTAATNFQVDLVTVRKGTTLLPELFYLNYTGNNYTTVTNTLTGAYNQCGLVEDPVGTVTRYGPEVFSAISQAAGYDTVLGNKVLIPNITGAVPPAGYAGATLYGSSGRLKWVGSDGLAYQGGVAVLSNGGSATSIATASAITVSGLSASVGSGTYYFQLTISPTYVATALTSTISFSLSTLTASSFALTGTSQLGTGSPTLQSMTNTTVASNTATFALSTGTATPGLLELTGYITFAGSGTGTFAVTAKGSSSSAYNIAAGAIMTLTPIA